MAFGFAGQIQSEILRRLRLLRMTVVPGLVRPQTLNSKRLRQPALDMRCMKTRLERYWPYQVRRKDNG